MKSTYTIKENFPIWYKSIDPIVTEELIDKRINAINSILDNEDIDFWLDVLRLALNVKVISVDNVTSFVRNFQSKDISFPITSNNNLVKILSQITLFALFESTNVLAITLSKVVCTSTFLQNRSTSKVPFYEKALWKLKEDSFDDKDIEEIRECLIERENELEDEPDEVNINNGDYINLTYAINYLINENKKVKEESDILWWLFGEYSLIYQDYFYSIGLSKMIFGSAIDLYNIVKSTSPLSSSEQILYKCLCISNNNNNKFNEITLGETINFTPKEIQNNLLLNGHLDELTPILYAIHLSSQLGEIAWTVAYVKKMKIKNLDSTIHPRKLAFQLFNELILMKKINQLNNE